MYQFYVNNQYIYNSIRYLYRIKLLSTLNLFFFPDTILELNLTFRYFNVKQNIETVHNIQYNNLLLIIIILVLNLIKH